MPSGRARAAVPLHSYRVSVFYRECTHRAAREEWPGPFVHVLPVAAGNENEATAIAREQFAGEMLRAEMVTAVERVVVVAVGEVVGCRCLGCGAVVAEPRTHCCPPSKPAAGPEDMTVELPLPLKR